MREDIHDWLSLDAIAGRPALPSSFELTDDERQLRDLSYPSNHPTTGSNGIPWPANTV